MKYISRRSARLATVLLIVAMTIGGTTIASRMTNASAPSCGSGGQVYQVAFQNNHVSPENTYAKKCDRIQFVNRDSVTRNISFGPHNHHVAYDGVLEKLLTQDQSFSINLLASGLYPIHDHFHDEVVGYFSVSE